jgi:catechol 2,3-dioxygenase-like lactoylglutathione lyase family enzyme/alkylhydroperoxidase family enzyme
MAHAPAVLLGYMQMRKALDEHVTLDRKVRTALLLSVAAADQSAYTVALNSLLARESGWSEDDVCAIRRGKPEDPRLAALLEVARQAAVNRGSVDDPIWQKALDAGWTTGELAEAFAFIGLTQFVDSFLRYARTDMDAAFARLSAADAATSPDQDASLTVLLIVEDQDRTRAFYEHVLGATVVRERDPVILKFHNSWVIANTGGGPTDDKPDVTLVPPVEPERASSALNIRVSDAVGVYELWKARGAHFLTPPVDRGREIRCYLRDPDGHLIEVGQSVPTASRS